MVEKLIVDVNPINTPRPTLCEAIDQKSSVASWDDVTLLNNSRDDFGDL